MEVHLGIAPINWSNDDIPELGGSISLETCLKEARLSGYTGIEIGNKFPRKVGMLKSCLYNYDLKLCGGWFSGELLKNSIEEEKVRLMPQIKLFKSLNVKTINYAETSNTIHNKPLPLNKKPVLDPGQMKNYAAKLTEIAKYTQENGLSLSYHYHAGTIVQNYDEIKALFDNTGEEVGILFDTGHLVFANGDIETFLDDYGNKINNIHFKDIRKEVSKEVNNKKLSFLDAVKKGVFTVPGDGYLDFDKICQRLSKLNYDGWVVVEAEQDPVKANPLDYALMAYNYLSGCFFKNNITVIK